MYRRYTLDEVKRKIVDVLQNARTGLSGIELADKTGLNRMTITKYLDVMQAIGLVKKKKIGTVNVWFLETGVADIEFPVNYIQVQQKLIEFVLADEEEQARRLLLSVLNSNVDQVKILTDIILPSVNTINELYSRGRIGKTERIHLSSVLGGLVDLVKFNSHPEEPKMNANVICVAGTDDMVHLAKSAAVAFQILGWNSKYVGSIEQDMDPFFDIDFQRYLSRAWGNRRGLLLVCILSSGEGPMRLLASTTRSMKGRLKGELRLAIIASPELHKAAEEGADLIVTDLQAVIDWAERQYLSIAS